MQKICAGADNPDADVWDIELPDDADFRPEPAEIAGHQVVALKATGIARDTSEWASSLYAPYMPPDEADTRELSVTAIPYYAWANRAAGPMAVWLPVTPAQ